MFGIDPNKPIDELLRNVQSASQQATRMTSMAFPAMAVLLVRLSQDASATAAQAGKAAEDNLAIARSNVTIQKRLIWLTAVILAITVAMFALQCIQYFQDA